MKIALAKAEALLAKVNEPALLITCDQVVHHQNKIREKPINNDECYLYLNSYQQEPATTVSAIVVTNTVTKKQVSGVDIAKQWFLPIPTDIVDAVIAKGDVHYCAGGFMIDEPLLMNYLGILFVIIGKN